MPPCQGLGHEGRRRQRTPGDASLVDADEKSQREWKFRNLIPDSGAKDLGHALSAFGQAGTACCLERKWGSSCELPSPYRCSPSLPIGAKAGTFPGCLGEAAAYDGAFGQCGCDHSSQIWILVSAKALGYRSVQVSYRVGDERFAQRDWVASGSGVDPSERGDELHCQQSSHLVRECPSP